MDLNGISKKQKLDIYIYIHTGEDFFPPKLQIFVFQSCTSDLGPPEVPTHGISSWLRSWGRIRLLGLLCSRKKMGIQGEKIRECSHKLMSWNYRVQWYNTTAV